MITFYIEDEVVACHFFLLFFSTKTSRNRLSLYTSLWFSEMNMKRHSNGLIYKDRKVTKNENMSALTSVCFQNRVLNFL